MFVLDYSLPIFLYTSVYLCLTTFYGYNTKVSRNIISSINCINSVVLPYLYIYRNIDTLEDIKYWCIGYFLYDSVLSIRDGICQRSVAQFGYLSHHFITIYLLYHTETIICLNAYFECEVSNLFLFLGYYLDRMNNNNLLFCKFVHIPVYIHIRLIRGYYTIAYLKYTNSNLFIVGACLYFLCFIGIGGLLIETREVSNKIKTMLRKDDKDIPRGVKFMIKIVDVTDYYTGEIIDVIKNMEIEGGI